MKFAHVAAVVLASTFIAGCGGAVDNPPGNPSTGASSTTAPGAASSAETPAGTSAPNAASSTTRTDQGWAAGALGCGNFEVFVTHASRRKFLVIDAQKNLLGLAKVGDSVSIPLSSTPDKRASLRVDTYDGTGGDAYYCNDVRQETPKKIGSVNAVSGTVRFTLSKLGANNTYSIDVGLEGVVVKAADGTTETIPDATYTDVGVGWLPG